LEQHPKVAWVQYPGLPSHPSHALAKRLLRPNAFGGVLSFGVKGDATVGSKVVDKLRLASNLANVGECLILFLPSTLCIELENNTMSWQVMQRLL
jgi:O-acetylhomoserine/O-acetylserine sulfhydrylase